MSEHETIARRVARGAARLDSAYGPEWRGLFASGRLPSLENFRLCVLARMEGTYHDGVMRLFPDPLGASDGLRTDWQRRQAIDHGFVAPERTPRDVYYNLLLEAWKAEIAKRFSKGAG